MKASLGYVLAAVSPLLLPCWSSGLAASSLTTSHLAGPVLTCLEERTLCQVDWGCSGDQGPRWASNGWDWPGTLAYRRTQGPRGFGTSWPRAPSCLSCRSGVRDLATWAPLWPHQRWSWQLRPLRAVWWVHRSTKTVEGSGGLAWTSSQLLGSCSCGVGASGTPVPGGCVSIRVGAGEWDAGRMQSPACSGRAQRGGEARHAG